MYSKPRESGEVERIQRGHMRYLSKYNLSIILRLDLVYWGKLGFFFIR